MRVFDWVAGSIHAYGCVIGVEFGKNLHDVAIVAYLSWVLQKKCCPNAGRFGGVVKFLNQAGSTEFFHVRYRWLGNKRGECPTQKGELEAVLKVRRHAGTDGRYCCLCDAEHRGGT